MREFRRCYLLGELVVMTPGRARKWISSAGGFVLAAGSALTVLGILAPFAHASTTSAYVCTLHAALGDVAFSMPMEIKGDLPGSVQQGDNATLNGFQTIGHVPSSIATVLLGLGATSVSGSYDSFDIDAAIGDVNLPPAHPQMDIASVPVAPLLGSFDMISPPSSTAVTFLASQPGTLTISAPDKISGTLVYTLALGGTDNIPFDCQGAVTTIASTTIKTKPTPPTHPTSPPASHAPPGHSTSATPSTSSEPGGLSGLGSSETPTATGTATFTPTSSGRASSTAATLPRTGASNALPLTVGGGLLVLVGTGLLYTSKRRGTPELDA